MFNVLCIKNRFFYTYETRMTDYGYKITAEFRAGD
jgi:hypothetical protein